MEASNLGAYLADKTDEETELALELIAQGKFFINTFFIHPQETRETWNTS